MIGMQTIQKQAEVAASGASGGVPLADDAVMTEGNKTGSTVNGAINS